MPKRSPMPTAIQKLWVNWHPEERKWLEELRDTIHEQHQDSVNQVTLFGSKARGDWHSESDIDVLIIIRVTAAG